MARCRFVTPDVVRLPLSDGDWIDVKKELNAGEHRKVFAGLVKSMRAGQTTELNPEKAGKTKILAYIVGWSLCDAKAVRVPFTEAALDALDADTYDEINEAVDAHEVTIEKERAERKNARAGELRSSAISLSAVS